MRNIFVLEYCLPFSYVRNYLIIKHKIAFTPTPRGHSLRTLNAYRGKYSRTFRTPKLSTGCWLSKALSALRRHTSSPVLQY